MFKVLILVALAIAGTCAQEAAEQNAAAEPYAYAYQTDSSSAQEQRSPDGRVSGFYTIVDATDGRERRVEYFADETGFHAKVATNELGTKSENSADVEVQASPPSEAQLAFSAQSYQQQAYQAAPQPQQFQQQQQYSTKQQYVTYQQQQPQRVVYTQEAPQQQAVTTTTVQQQPATAGYVQRYQTYVQQPYGFQYGHFPAAAYGGYGSGSYSNQASYGVQHGGQSYNYHTPAQYYGAQQSGGLTRTTTTTVQGAPVGVSTYSVGGQGVGGGQVVSSRYVSSSRTVPVSGGATSYSYSSGPVSSSSSSRTVTTSSGVGPQGSGNLLFVQKA